MNREKEPPIPLFRVGEITRNIRRVLEGNFSRLGIKGELSSFVRHSSGHWYFTLKDSSSQIKGVMFRGANKKMSFEPKTGMEVIVWGQISVYEPRGDYQILSHSMERAGDGDMQKAFEALKKKLKSEGLFDQKRPLPFLPKHIAVITSPDGAALKDVLNVLHRRHSGIQVTLSPALMEGKSAAESVILAFHQALKLKDIELILITRGGGSAESLWPFNDEALARAIFESPIPTVSAIGHEIDFTILDFICDLRAPTPSASAELISKNADTLLQTLIRFQKSLISSIQNRIEHLTNRIQQSRRVLPPPEALIQDALLKLDDQVDRLHLGVKNVFKNHHILIQKWETALQHLSPLQVMERGFSLCYKEGRIIQDAKHLNKGDDIQVHFLRGRVLAEVRKNLKP